MWAAQQNGGLVRLFCLLSIVDKDSTFLSRTLAFSCSGGGGRTRASWVLEVGDSGANAGTAIQGGIDNTGLDERW